MLFIIAPVGELAGSIELDQLAFEKFNCLGKVDYSMDEALIDELLGKKAYCGGELPDDVLNIIESHQEENGLGSYFWENEDEANLFACELETLGLKFSRSTEENKDWNESWRKEFKEIVVSDSLKIVPSWEKVAELDSENELYIYPGMGFGTGNHETTFLCLKLYESVRTNGPIEKVLDFGCGSGILGIASIKKDRSSVDFVDIDADALDNCLQNLDFNDYQNYSLEHSLVLRDRFTLEKTYDLVFANILENVLVAEKDLISQSVSQSGHLIVSGLLLDQEQGIVDLYKSLGFTFVESVKKGDWVAILFKQ